MFTAFPKERSQYKENKPSHCFNFNFTKATMSCRKQLEVKSDSGTPHSWCLSLREDVFDSFMSGSGPLVNKVFGEGSLFSPMLFGKFFDPSDAFPLWEFQSDILLSSLRKSGADHADWTETDIEYALKAELPGVKKYTPQVLVEGGNILEISGQWREQPNSGAKDWKSGRWWEAGYVRRLELPDDADWRKVDAKIDDDVFLEIRIPKNSTIDSEAAKGNDGPHV